LHLTPQYCAILAAGGCCRRRFRNPRLERVPRELMFRKLIEACKRSKGCHYCGAVNGTVK
jgi:hypothetical protein